MTKKGCIAGAAACLALSATSAQASTGCWSDVESAAAKVRTLQTRLMDATLRCQIVGADITPAYNAFVRINRPTLQGANAVLRKRLGEREYDRFVTFLANDSADQAIDREHCAAAALIANAGVIAAGDVEKLLALADEKGVQPKLEGGRCGIVFTATSAFPVAAESIGN